MKKFILGFVSASVLIALTYFGYPYIRGFFGGSQPVSPQELKPGVTDFGALRVKILGAGKPLSDLEVDLGEPGGTMSYMLTDKDGVAFFENVPVGQLQIFFNDLNFPKEYVRVSSPVIVNIVKDKITEKEIKLTPKQ